MSRTIIHKQDALISQLTVRLKETNSNRVIGTGLLYYSDHIRDNVYIITAAHCLYSDGDSFQNVFSEISIDLYNNEKNNYFSITTNVNNNLLFKESEKDIAIIILDRAKVGDIMGSIPIVKIVTTRQSKIQFIIKGFPNATKGEELDVIYPTWKQEMTSSSRFQLQLHEDYTDYTMEGFSGSGVFLYDEEDVYVYGIFTRFRSEENGRVIYGQHIELINELLNQNFLPTINFDYLGDSDLNHTFFKKHIEKSIDNLGQRYSKKLNLELPISKFFNDLFRDSDFEHRFKQSIDNWLVKFRNLPSTDSPLYDIQSQQAVLKNQITNWLSNISFNVTNKIEIQWILVELSNLQELIKDKISELYELQSKKISEDEKKEKPYNYRRPFEEEINKLREIESTNSRLELDFQNKININLTNFPVLIIKGEAGSGKSHLLGDIAQNRLDKGMPSILLLGQHFKASMGVEQNIINLLGIKQGFEQTLNSLNQIGEQLNERVPILIDAINEGAGINLWKDEILGLIKSVTNYPYLGLVLTVRTTYFNSIADSFDDKISIINHEGFAGNEYAALKLFCDAYGLKQPNFPILAPEFTKPLFLILICKGIQNSKDKEFPQGFQGIAKIFNYYLSALETRFTTLREEYVIIPKIVNKAIQKFCEECFNRNKSVLQKEEVHNLFLKEFPSHQFLLYDLIQESVFISNLQRNYMTGEDEEVIYFAYERFGDHFMANQLTIEFSSKEQILEAFSKDGKFGKLIEDYWQYGGILESLAILLPEKFGLELFEVYNWIYVDFYEKDSFLYQNTIEWLDRYFMDSLKWRSVESIDVEKVNNWLKGDYFAQDYYTYLLQLVELSIIKEHPFNSNRLHNILSSYSISERDGFWQQFMLWYSGYNDDGVGFPIRRLVDWAWSPGISSLIDNETAILTAQTLSWVLASTDRKLRDEVTKALVNLLEQQPEALIEILKRFDNIDDMYIKERLYAVAYGCALRTKKLTSIEMIGDFVYKNIFSESNPPEHILLRDYARNTVEYMVYRGLSQEVNLKKIRPPYKSKLPDFPLEEEMNQYDIDHNSSEYDQKYGRIHNRIHFSVMSWDFGKKTIVPIIEKFHLINFLSETKNKRFLKNISIEQDEHLTSLVKIMDDKDILLAKNNKHYIDEIGGQTVYDKLILDYEKAIKVGIEVINILFQNKSEYVVKEILPYLYCLRKLKYPNYYHKSNHIQPIKRWIVKRVFNLGYNVQSHGDYDLNRDNHYYYRNSDIELISEKYQWIAFHEILSILTDNYKIKDWYSNKKYEYYEGPWQFSLRDIDPIQITKDPLELEEDDMMILKDNKEWWEDQKYQYWSQQNDEWVRNIQDLPIVKFILNKKDDENNEWLFLNKFVEWKMPKPIGIDKYSGVRKTILYLIQGYIIKKKDKQKIINFLDNKSFFNRWMPEASDESNQLFSREKYWSPLYLNNGRDQDWMQIFYNHTSTKLSVMPISLDAKSSISGDKSGAESSYYIPCEQLFNDLSMVYGSTDGDFENQNGKLIARNISGSRGLMINKKILTDYLEKNDLDIIWTLLGEKMAFTSYQSENYFSVPCGVFYLENGEIKGQLNYYERD